MKILITGANGLLGANVARTLFRAGEELVLFVRSNADMKGIVDLPCEIVYGDILDAEAISSAIAKVDAVVHVAATTDVLPHPFSYYESVNINGTKNILHAMLLLKRQRLIYVSTANTFAPGSKEQPGTELNSFSFFNYGSGYINSKYIAQQLVLESVEKFGLDAVVVNPTFMIGAYDCKPSSGQIILHALKARVVWSPAGGKNFVSVKDVADGIHNALYYGKRGQCYLLAGENLSYKQFFQMVKNMTKGNQRIIVVPKAFLYVAGIIGSALNWLNLKKVSFTLSNMRLLSIDNYYSSAKAQDGLRLINTPVSNAVEEAMEWFKTYGYIKEHDC